MRQNLKKAKTIVQAFTEKLPVEEKWYQDRLAICAGCDYNSDNVPEEKKTTAHKLREVTNICPEKRWCTACGCCIDRKASRKEEACGLKSQGKTPLWPALEVEVSDNTLLTIISDGQQPYTIKEELGRMILDLGEVSSDVVDLSFQVFAPKSYQFVNAKGDCGCTTSSSERIDDNHMQFNVRISTIGFSTVVATVKRYRVDYDQGSISVYIRMAKTAK